MNKQEIKEAEKGIMVNKILDNIDKLQNKANKYDSLVKKIKDKIEWLTDNILDNDYASDNDKDTAEYQVDILQELLEGK